MAEVLDQPTTGRAANASADIKPPRPYQPPMAQPERQPETQPEQQSGRPFGMMPQSDYDRLSKEYDDKEQKAARPVATPPASATTDGASNAATNAASSAIADVSSFNPQAAKQAVKSVEEGDVSGAVTGVAGSVIIPIMWGSLFSGVGALWALPFFDIYIFIGMIKKDSPFFQQLSTKQKWIILFINLVVILLIALLFFVIAETYCNSLAGVAYKAATALSGQPDYCKAINNLLGNMAVTGVPIGK